MTYSRRAFLKSTASGLAAASAASIVPLSAQAADTIKVGLAMDTSGPMSIYGIQKHRCIELGVEEVNKAGGLLGKQIELVHYDTQSKEQLYAQYGQRLGLRDRVAVVHGGITSSSREVIRPVLGRTKTLYFYNTQYEGGVCDRNTFCTGTSPGQLLANLIPYCIKNFGPKIYVLGADYNFGQISAAWTKKIAQENGGEVIATEFFPLDVAQFGATIGKIQKAKPDFVINTFVGPAHASFYGQWFSAGMKKEIPLASQTFGVSGEILAMPTEVSEGIVACYNYFDEIDTPANKSFRDRFKAKYGEKIGYLGDLAVNSYQGWWLWVDAVKKAGSTDREAVIKALESGLSIEGPSGTVTVDAATHHNIVDMYLGVAKGNAFEIVNTYPGSKPTNPGNQCDLVKNPSTNTQFEPKI